MTATERSDILRCPEGTCLQTSRIVHRFVLESTCGPIEYAVLCCEDNIGHWFTITVKSLEKYRFGKG